MRRIAGTALLLCAVALAASTLGPGAQAADTYRVDAIFDTAKGIIPGQLVKIAGARAGEIKDVVLTDDHKARIQMEVDSKFAPFRSDAHCAIQPEGLISENFVQCLPGTPEGRELRPQGDEAATVPVENTSVPIALTDLFNIWRTPVRQRFTLVVNTLGLGVAGRGEDFNALLRRANPTLALLRRAVAALNRQRGDIATIVEASDRVIAELAERSPRVGEFIERSDRVTAQTASHRTALAEAVRRLPRFLAEAEPALRSLDRFTVDGTPVVRDLRASAPGLERAITELGPFARAARPALSRLGSTAVTGRKVARNGTRLVNQLRKVADAARPTVGRVEGLVTDLVNKGVVEGFLSFVYYAAAAASRYDATSHFLPVEATINQCTMYATTPTPGCSSKWADSPSSQPVPRRRAASDRKAAPAPSSTAPAPAQVAPTPAPQTPAPSPAGPVQSILDSVLGGGSPPRSDRPLGALLDYLLMK